MLNKKLAACLKKNYDWALKTLKKCISIPSVSAQGKGIEETVRFLLPIFRRLGFEVRTITSGGCPIIYAQRNIPNAKKTILFYDHYDVQPPDPLDEWNTSPFKPTVRSGQLFGRGCADDKGNLIVRLAAVKSLLEAHHTLPVNVKFFLEGEEEIGSPTLPRFEKKHRGLIKADLCIWESGGRSNQGHPYLALGCKGICTCELAATGPKSDLHSAQGVIVPNPAWQLVWTLAKLKDKNERILIPGFYEQVSQVSASERATLKNSGFNEKGRLDRWGIKGFLLGLKGQRLKERYFYSPVLNINGLTSGYQGQRHKTILPSVASAKIDFRLVPDQMPADISKKLQRHLNHIGTGVKIVSFHGYPAARTSRHHPYVNLVKSVLEKVYNQPAAVTPFFIASGPMYLFSPRMPCICTGIGHPRANIHAPNENIYLRDILPGMKSIAGIMLGLAKAKSKQNR